MKFSFKLLYANKCFPKKKKSVLIRTYLNFCSVGSNRYNALNVPLHNRRYQVSTSWDFIYEEVTFYTGVA